MGQRYIIPVSSLLHVAKEMKKDKMKYVEISLYEPEFELPARVHFYAREDGVDVWTDYDDIESLDLDA